MDVQTLSIFFFGRLVPISDTLFLVTRGSIYLVDQQLILELLMLLTNSNLNQSQQARQLPTLSTHLDSSNGSRATQVS